MNKLRRKETQLLVKGYILCNRNEVLTFSKLILVSFPFLIYEETMLSEAVSLEPCIQVI